MRNILLDEKKMKMKTSARPKTWNTCVAKISLLRKLKPRSGISLLMLVQSFYIYEGIMTKISKYPPFIEDRMRSRYKFQISSVVWAG